MSDFGSDATSIASRLVGVTRRDAEEMLTMACNDPNSAVMAQLTTLVEDKVSARMDSYVKKKKRSMPVCLTRKRQDKLISLYPEYAWEYLESAQEGHAMGAAIRVAERCVLYDNVRSHEHVVEVGGNPAALLLTGKQNFHCCCPILDERDSARDTLRSNCIESRLRHLRQPEIGFSRKKAGYKLSDSGTEKLRERKSVQLALYEDYAARTGVYKCHNKAQSCLVAADRLISVHSNYDIAVGEIVDIMKAHSCDYYDGVILYTSDILVADHGYLPISEAVFDIDREADKIVMSFVEDSSLDYTHRYSEYVKYGSNHLFESDGSTYFYEVVQRRGESLFFRMTRVNGTGYPAPVCNNMFVLNEAREKTCIDSFKYNYYRGRKDSESYEPLRVVVPTQLFDNVYASAMVMTDDSLSLNNVFKFARTMNVVLIINGVTITAPESVDEKTLSAMVTAIFVMQICKRMKDKKTLALLIKGELRRQSLADSSFLNIFMNSVFRNTLGYVLCGLAIVKEFLLELQRSEMKSISLSYPKLYRECSTEVSRQFFQNFDFGTDFATNQGADYGSNDLLVDDDLVEQFMQGLVVEVKDGDIESEIGEISSSVPVKEVEDLRISEVDSDEEPVDYSYCVDEQVAYLEKSEQILLTESRAFGKKLHLAGVTQRRTMRMLRSSSNGENIITTSRDGENVGILPIQSNYMAGVALKTGEVIMSSSYRVGDEFVTKFPHTEGGIFVSDDFVVFNQAMKARSIASCKTRVKWPHKVYVVQGNPGVGKTSLAVKKFSSRMLFLCVTKSNVTDVSKQLETKFPKVLISRRIRTVDSYLLKPNVKAEILVFDEGYMAHPGDIVAALRFSGATHLVIMGDEKQIPFINRIQSSFVLRYSKLPFEYNLYSIIISRRIPKDVAVVLRARYNGNLFTTSEVDKSLEFVKINSETEVPRKANVQYITYYQEEKEVLLARGGYGEVKTVHEIQGRTIKDVALVRLSTISRDLYVAEAHVTVAISRHTHSFVYYSKGAQFGDSVGQMIKAAETFSKAVLTMVEPTKSAVEDQERSLDFMDQF